MTVDTSIRVTDASGVFLFETRQFLEIGNAPGLHYVLSCGKPGALTVTLPPEFNPLLLKDGRIHVMRSVNGNPAQREGNSCFLIRRWDYADNYTIVTALHANHLLWRRDVLYNGMFTNDGVIAGLNADDAIKAVWQRNAGSSINATYHGYSTVTAAADQTQADLSAFVSVQANLAAAPTVDKFTEYRSVGDAILELEDYSYSAGTYLTAEIVAPSESTLELQTFTGQRGVDRRVSSGNGLIFSAARGNFANGILTVDAQNEITFGYAIGQGVSDRSRMAGYALDTTRMGESPFGRIEAIFDAGDAPNDANLTKDAGALVRGKRPIIQAKGELVDTDTCMRSIHYNFGDLVTVELRGIQYDMRIDLLDVTINAAGETTRTGFFYNG